MLQKKPPVMEIPEVKIRARAKKINARKKTSGA
jgi:hypothetical protein